MAGNDRKGIGPRTIAVALISILLLVGLLWLADPRRLADILSQANLWIIGVVLLLYVGNLLTKGLRWYYILDRSGLGTSFRTALSFVVVGLSVNSVTPGRIAGEPVRAYLLKERTETSFGHGLATVFTERIMDLLVLATFAILGLSMIVTLLPFTGGLAIAASIVLVILVLAGVVYLALNLTKLDSFARWLVRMASRIGRRPLPRWENAVSDTITSFSNGFRSILRSRRTASVAFGLTAVIWLNEATRVFLVMYALAPGSVPFVGFVLVASSLATLLGSFIPGGTLNVALIAMVFNASGVDIALATTAGLLMTFTSIWILVPFGIAIVVRNASRVKKEKEKGIPIDTAIPSRVKE